MPALSSTVLSWPLGCDRSPPVGHVNPIGRGSILWGATRLSSSHSCSKQECQKSSKTKDVYQKFINILDAQPHIWDLAPIPNPKGDPPVPLRQADPPLKSVVGNPATNPKASVGFNWVPGRIPTDEWGSPEIILSQESSSHQARSVPPQGVHSHSTFFLTRGPNLVRGNWQTETPMG